MRRRRDMGASQRERSVESNGNERPPPTDKLGIQRSPPSAKSYEQAPWASDNRARGRRDKRRYNKLEVRRTAWSLGTARGEAPERAALAADGGQGDQRTGDGRESVRASRRPWRRSAVPPGAGSLAAEQRFPRPPVAAFGVGRRAPARSAAGRSACAGSWRCRCGRGR